MSKIRRNDPCPCGSGKKYKKCCGRHQDNKTDASATNKELYQVHQELISLTTNEMDHQLNQQLQKYEEPTINDKETLEVYNTGLIPWIIAMVPFLKNNETILKNFYNSIKSNISSNSRIIFEKWLSSSPSIYEVVSIGVPKEHFLLIKDLYTQDTFYVPYQNADDFIEGSLLIGIIVPFADHHNFLFTMVKLFQRNTERYRQLLNKFNDQSEDLSISFPKLLAQALNTQLLENQWGDSTYEEVAHLMTDHMTERDLNDRIIMESLSSWRTFCEKEKPVIRKIEPYAAAMDYYAQRNIIIDSDITQQQIAQEYGTTASMLSTVFRRITKSL